MSHVVTAFGLREYLVGALSRLTVLWCLCVAANLQHRGGPVEDGVAEQPPLAAADAVRLAAARRAHDAR